MFEVDLEKREIIFSHYGQRLTYNGKEYSTNYLKTKFRPGFNSLPGKMFQGKGETRVDFCNFIEKYYKTFLQNKAFVIFFREINGYLLKSFLMVEKILTKEKKENLILDFPLIQEIAEQIVNNSFFKERIPFLLDYYAKTKNKEGKRKAFKKLILLIETYDFAFMLLRRKFLIPFVRKNIPYCINGILNKFDLSLFKNFDEDFKENLIYKAILSKDLKIPSNSKAVLGYYNLLLENLSLIEEIKEIEDKEVKKEIEVRRKKILSVEKEINGMFPHYKIEILTTKEEFIKAGEFMKNCIGRGSYYSQYLREKEEYYLIFSVENKPGMCACFLKSKNSFSNIHGYRNRMVEPQYLPLLKNLELKRLLKEMEN